MANNPVVIDPPVLPGPRYNVQPGHQHIRPRLPSPGGMAWVFANLGLAEFSFVGPGHANHDSIKPLQPPTWFAGHAVPVQGLGGVIAGQLVNMPLIDPNNPFGD